MIKVSGKANVKEVVQSLLTQLESSGAISTISVNGGIGLPLDDSFRYGSFDLICDSLHETQKIRFRIEVGELACGITVGTDTTIDELGSVTAPYISDDLRIPYGQMFCDGGEVVWYEYRSKEEAPLETTGIVFDGYASFSDHGITMAVWEQNSIIEGTNFSWFVVQRPVNPDGSTYVEDRAPALCIFGSTPDISNSYNVQYCVVREYDVNVPTQFKSAHLHHADRVAVVNVKEQVAIAPSRKACLFFPSGFNTQRYYYSLELDMFAYTSADVISMSSTITDDRFGTLKSYIALNANRKLNQGMRVILYNGDV